MSELPEIETTFFEENKKLDQTRPKKVPKKGGPYSKDEKQKRRDEVYRLHFDYGYSARKIADLMKINRHTIDGDIDYWYSKTVKDFQHDPYKVIRYNIHQLDIQKTRLREQLDKSPFNKDRIPIERMIFDINSKIIQIHVKMVESSYKVHSQAVNWLNDWMKAHKKDERYMTWFDIISVSTKASQRIKQIINEDKKR